MKHLRAIVVCGLLAIGGAGSAAAQAGIGARGSCVGVEDLGRFTIRSARLRDPFWMLRWRTPSPTTVAAIDSLKGASYSFPAVNAVSKQIESETWLGNASTDSVHVDFSTISVENCQQEQLDVTFTVFSAAVSPTVSPLFEWRSGDRPPHEFAGVVRGRPAWRVAPQVGFDQALRTTIGARAEANWTAGRAPFDGLEVAGLGSTESHAVAAELTGGHDVPARWLRHTSWGIDVTDWSAPAGPNHVKERGLSARFAATSRPHRTVVTRFGAVIEGGRQESSFQHVDLPSGIVSDTNFTSLGVFGGLTGRARRQAFTATYGLTLGSTSRGFHGDWRKHLADVAHDLWLPIADHRVFEIEQQLTLGRLQTLGPVPVTTRFLGGASNAALRVADDWHIRTSPVVRSIPTNQFSTLGIGLGGDRFIAYNLTSALTAWGMPVVPKELLADPEFSRQLTGQLASARSTLDVVYRADDSNFHAIRTRLSDLLHILNEVASAESAARSGSVLSSADFEPCEDSLQASRSATEHAAADKPFQAYGWVAEMLPDGSSALADVVSMCGADLVEKLRTVGAGTTALESTTQDLQRLADAIAAHFRAIDTRKSAASAAKDMNYADTALDVILKQLNVTSVSPVFLFDVATMRRNDTDSSGATRFALGGGIRFTLLSTVSVTATYAINPRAQPREGSSAFVVSLTTRNLFD